ncbi:NADPH:quinone oxidoreductase [Platysternon megacephalum]|uniref:NADPH:quinone oxidoreductase n=1 Tax=Platysternon megacephalum TaxID=55544 RepID=A0A4D9DCY7_9SAUR|nr:NADPH:quinone oxidoreductase [Platysternon megacephalum]
METFPVQRRASLRRWGVFLLVALANAIVQFFWICYSAVSTLAEKYFHVDGWSIGVLAMVYMVAYVIFGIPASLLIDRIGHAKSVGIAILVTAVGGIGRGLAGSHYLPVLVCTVLLAAVQPLILNAWLVFVYKWFPIRRHTMVLGLLTASNLVGVMVGLLLPALVVTSYTLGWLSWLQIWVGVVALVIALFYLLVVRESSHAAELEREANVRLVSWAGMRHALRQKSFWGAAVGIFVGMGSFTGVLQWMSEILLPYGFSGLHAAILGGSLLLLGSISTVIVGYFVDKTGRELPFGIVGVFTGAIGCLILAYSLEFVDLAIGAALVGIGLISVMPIALSYTAKVVWPTSEATANGLIQLAAQSSVIYVALMYAAKTSEGLYWMALLITAILLMAWGVLLALLPESRDVVRRQHRRVAGSSSDPDELPVAITPHRPM